MKKLSAMLILVLLTLPAWGEAPAPEEEYKQPFPHSSGADLLAYCEQTEVIVSQLRCDYYVQGVADLVTIPLDGVRIACIPQGQNRTQLMNVAMTYLKRAKPEVQQGESAASLIAESFVKAYPCPKQAKKPAASGMSAAMKKALAKRLKGAAAEVKGEVAKPTADTAVKKSAGKILTAEEKKAIYVNMLKARKNSEAASSD
jgi:hypothetical protein